MKRKKSKKPGKKAEVGAGSNYGKKTGFCSVLLKKAVSSASSKGVAAKRQGNALRLAQACEAARIKATSNYLGRELHRTVAAFPSIDAMHPFYRELLEANFGTVKLKKALAHLQSISRIIKKIRFETTAQLYSEKQPNRVRSAGRRFIARAASLLQDCEESMLLVRRAAKELKKMPQINFGCFSVILAGYPNVGKTTILKRLTGSAPKIAPYPFTTKSIGLGYFEHNYMKIQVIDTPGLLDRQMEKRNPVERKAVSALRQLEGAIAFIIDPTAHCGYTVQEQLNLLAEIRAAFPKKQLVIVLNKADLATQEQIAAIGDRAGEFVLSGENDAGELKKKITEIAGPCPLI